MGSRISIVWLLGAGLLGSCGSEDGAMQPDAALPRQQPERCTMTPVYPDADGDGHPATTETSRSVCAEDGIVEGFTPPNSLGGVDCDDAEPQVWQWLCADRDGDGAVSEVCVGDNAAAGLGRCPLVVEWTPEPGPYDCQDDDPSLIDYFYVDADRDGYGAGEPQCGQGGPGFSAWGGDCADDDPLRSPAGLEVFADGVDGDCDGSDGALCGGDSSLFDFSWPDTAELVDASCVGPQLALGVLSCSSCYHAQATFAVGNRGNTRFEGQVTLSGVEGSFWVELEPGERRMLVSGPFRSAYLLGFAAAEVVDCSPGDNGVSVPSGHCI